NAKRHEVRELLGNIYDIDRLSNKVSLGSANARDMVSLSSSLKNIKALRNLLDGALPEKLGNISEELDDFGDIIKWIDECVADEPPVSLRDGGLVAFGYDTEVDELRDIVNGGKDWIIQLQKKEIERTGISSLKVGYNRVFGYYIEVTNTNLDSIPENYIRKQTLANAERFITGELKDHESKVIMAGERMKSVEYDIFLRLREKVGGEIERLKRTAGLVAEVDVITCLSEAAVKNNYVRPCVDQDGILDVKDGRHPVLEKLLKDKEFVPNDIVMGGEAGNMFVITGSNMAGKSTYIRQVALITIMAQMGSFVPASSAVIGVVDRVFTRVGASDRLYKGMSTFMVEMLETANILNNATGRSLIILDEIGRGTSTYDGVSIAWAVMEYINEHLTGSKTLFATHFHELTELAGMLPGVKNYNLAIREWKEEVIFLYKVVEGSCDESFGIHVAKLAGMPLAVVRRSREILNNLQKDSLLGNMRNRFSHDNFLREKQLDLFEQKAGDAVIRKIREMDIDNLTPFEALSVIVELKKETR
ncbi:MAG: DNA mismatch repair protein MutS, partial [Candidatus Omnitrophica bacterium]|nr:DNA mismatch repair protein MutS [Candidatus Omnitrophota bacterium]